MHEMRQKKNPGRFETCLVILVTALSLFGVVMIGSASGWAYDASYPSLSPLMIKQLAGLAAGLAAAMALQLVSFPVLKAAAIPFYAVVAVLLVVTLFYGTGAEEGDEVRRWLEVGEDLTIQPSEIAKISLILLLGVYLERFRKSLDSFPVVLGALLMIGIFSFLILKEPDLSTTMVILALSVACLVVGGIHPFYLGIGLVLAGVALYVIFADALSETPRFLNAYQAQRILAWLRPEDYALTTAYQTVQSRNAIASGGLLGKGLFQNSGMVPIAETDFIFGVIGEELGLVGASLLILVYVVLALMIFSQAAKSEQLFGKVICVGVGVMISFQAAVHIGVSCAVLPNTGLPLPFVSYGLSSLIANWVGIGLVMRVRKENMQLSTRRSLL